ncbi:MAG: FprA family A-type flavoprotein [Clostridia bacterium]|nr:FprA family A-type flavoprotein [Clostridia bacterium]
MKNEIINIGIPENPFGGGASLNAWLLTGEKNILIDGVPEKHAEEYIKNISAHISPDKIDCIVMGHASPERTGCLKRLLELNGNIKVYASVAGLRNIEETLNFSVNGEICKNGGRLEAGDNSLEFYLTPNVTWPDTMLTYSKQHEALFTGELFSSAAEGAAEFYEKNLRFFVPYVKAAVKKVKDISPKVLYPGRGTAPARNINELTGLYDRLYAEKFQDTKKVLLAYASRSGNTAAVAGKIQNKLESRGVSVLSFDLTCCTSLQRVAKAAEDADGLVLGTYTNKRTMPQCVWDFISSLNVNLMSGKPYFVFGSQGWSGEGVFMADSILSMLKLRHCGKALSFTLAPSESDISSALQYAQTLADKLSEVQHA